MGKPFPGVTMGILDDQYNELGAGESVLEMRNNLKESEMILANNVRTKFETQLEESRRRENQTASTVAKKEQTVTTASQCC